jgi:ribose 5-phosphate isomerase A
MIQRRNVDDKAKEAVGYAAAKFVQPGMLVGLGTGTTAIQFIRALGRRCREGLSIKALATSLQSHLLAHSLGIPMLDPQETAHLDLTVDGADAIDGKKRMIKGGGGALFREKVVAYMSDEMIVIIEAKKQVEQLMHVRLPVEILPFCFRATLRHLEEMGFSGQLRSLGEQHWYLTENQNYILDVDLSESGGEPEEIEQRISAVPGVVETGFFLNIATKVVVGFPNGDTVILD